MQIYLSVCVDKNGGISKNNEIPWDIKEDMNFFIDQLNKPTLNKKLIVCGKNTYQKVMNTKDVYFLVISTIFQSNNNNIKVLNNLDHLKNHLYTFYENYDIFILGGKNIYDYALKNLSNIDFRFSHIDYDYSCDNNLDNFNMNFEIYIADLPSKSFIVKDNKNNHNVNITFYSKTFNNKTNNIDEQKYIDLLEYVLIHGERRHTRNSITLSVFGKTLEFSLDKFPLLTTKKMFIPGIFEELMFFIRGKTNSTELTQKGVKIWNDNTSREFLDKMGFTDRSVGDMGPLYGYQWRHFNAKYTDCNGKYDNTGYDQLAYCINLLKTDPTSRRIIMTTFNPVQAFEGVLFPCHGITIMFYCKLINNNNYLLDIMMTQRSCDLFLGVPFNIASYALLNYLICNHINNSDSKFKYIPGRLIMNLGDVHIYEEHYTQTIRQILRMPVEFPTLHIISNNNINIESYEMTNIKIDNYISYPGIIAKMIA